MRDKIIHFIFGSVIGAAVCIAGGSPIAVMAATASAGVAKELIDATGRGNAEFLDALATAVGGLPVAAAAWAW